MDCNYVCTSLADPVASRLVALPSCLPQPLRSLTLFSSHSRFIYVPSLLSSFRSRLSAPIACHRRATFFPFFYHSAIPTFMFFSSFYALSSHLLLCIRCLVTWKSSGFDCQVEQMSISFDPFSLRIRE